MFANQYAQINKEAKQELRALKKEEEAYNRSLAEFNLNQNEKTRAEVQRREGILRERQGNIANVVSKQAELDLRAAQANLQAGDSAKDRAFRLFAARIGDQAKASQLKTEYEQAVIKANAARAKGQADVANREAARAAELLKAIEDFNKASPQVIASRERTAASAANNAPLGSGMYDDGFGELIK
jgi:hypothetical protein